MAWWLTNVQKPQAPLGVSAVVFLRRFERTTPWLPDIATRRRALVHLTSHAVAYATDVGTPCGVRRRVGGVPEEET